MVEAVAYRMGYIDATQLQQLAHALRWNYMRDFLRGVNGSPFAMSLAKRPDFGIISIQRCNVMRSDPEIKFPNGSISTRHHILIDMTDEDTRTKSNAHGL